VVTCLVSVNFVKGQRDAIAARMPAEQAHVRALMERGEITSLHVAADQSRVWLVMPGESQEDVRRALTSFPLYPYMELELTPLLELQPAPRA